MCAFVCLENGRRDLIEGTGSSKSAVSQGDTISSSGFCSPKASGNYEDKSVFSIHCLHWYNDKSCSAREWLHHRKSKVKSLRLTHAEQNEIAKVNL